MAKDKNSFCFTQLYGTSCNANDSGIGDSSNNVNAGTYHTGYDLTVANLNFKFRAYDDAGKSRNWKIKPVDIRFCGNVSNAGNCTTYNDENSKILVYSNYIDRITITGPGTNIIEEKWEPEKSNDIKGGSNQDNSQTYYSTGLMVILKKEWLSTLLPGDYKVRVRVQGWAVGQGNTSSDLDIILAFNVPDNVKISGLETVDFGTFSENFNAERTITQSVCAHAQGEGGFKISTSNDKAGYILKGETNTSQTIAYEVAFGPDANNLTTLPYGGNGTAGTGFTGHLSDNCNGLTDENMFLGITLTESFESLSTKPADHYSDTLTLTISPD